MNGYRVAVVGATGAVGRRMVQTLEDRDFPVSSLRLLASSRSAGSIIRFKGEDIEVEELTKDSFDGVRLALFSAGSSISRQYADIAVSEGTIVVDNSKAFRMDPKTPLVVPEVNPQDVEWHEGIIANPNCSTIQMVVALKPLHNLAKIKRIVVATYQAVSGTGWKAMVELEEQSKAYLATRSLEREICLRHIPLKGLVREIYPHQIAFNVLPHIGDFLPDGNTEEELKMIEETKKIMGDNSIKVSATTVRVPVFIAHSEAINVEFKHEITPEQAREALESAPGVVVIDEPEKAKYPLPIEAAHQEPVYVGRIRRDNSVPHGLNLWVVADNLGKGAALNAVQIGELLIEKGLLL